MKHNCEVLLETVYRCRNPRADGGCEIGNFSDGFFCNYMRSYGCENTEARRDAREKAMEDLEP